MTGQKNETRTLSCSSSTVTPVNVTAFLAENNCFEVSVISSKRPLDVAKPQRA